MSEARDQLSALGPNPTDSETVQYLQGRTPESISDFQYETNIPIPESIIETWRKTSWPNITKNISEQNSTNASFLTGRESTYFRYGNSYLILTFTSREHIQLLANTSITVFNKEISLQAAAENSARHQ